MITVTMEVTSAPEVVTQDQHEPVRILADPILRNIYIVIGTLGFVGNIFVVIVIFNGTSMRKILTNTYIINQSLVDATVSVFLILTSVLEDDGRRYSSISDVIYCKAWLTKVWLWGMLVSSTYNLLALTLERYLAIVHPIWHKINFTRNKVIVSIGIIWIFGPAYNCAYMFPTSGLTPGGVCTVYNLWPQGIAQNAVGVLTIVIQFIIPLILLVCFYIRMFLVLRRRVAPGNNSCVDQPGNAKKTDSMARARKNILKTLIIVGVSFIFCWTWNQVYFLMFNLGYKAVDFTSIFYHFTVVMVFLNCCVNPFIYIAKYEQFQKAMKKMFCRNKAGSVTSDSVTSAFTVQAAGDAVG